MLTQQGLNRAVSRISLLPFFPSSDDSARAVIIEELGSLCESDAQAVWLALRMGQVFNKWPGIALMRAFYCKRFKPADGCDVAATSEDYPDGFPSEAQLGPLQIKGLPLSLSERLQLEGSSTIPTSRQLSDGHVSADSEADHLVLDMVPLKTLPPVIEFHASGADERRVDNLLREMYHLPPIPVVEPAQVPILEPPAPEPRFELTERPPQRITTEEVEAARQAVLLRRQRMSG